MMWLFLYSTHESRETKKYIFLFGGILLPLFIIIVVEKSVNYFYCVYIQRTKSQDLQQSNVSFFFFSFCCCNAWKDQNKRIMTWNAIIPYLTTIKCTVRYDLLSIFNFHTSTSVRTDECFYGILLCLTLKNRYTYQL